MCIFVSVLLCLYLIVFVGVLVTVIVPVFVSSLCLWLGCAFCLYVLVTSLCLCLWMCFLFACVCGSGCFFPVEIGFCFDHFINSHLFFYGYLVYIRILIMYFLSSHISIMFGFHFNIN